MRFQALLLLSLLCGSHVALAEGGCPQGMTPVNNGQNWTCIPGGNDPAGGQAQQAAAPPQPTGWWEKTWGAIAPSGRDAVLGTAVGASSEADAERLAMADCKAKGGEGCKVQITYRNQCAVMVVGDQFLGTAHAESVEMASDIGIRNCDATDTNCKVYYSACTEPKFHRY